MQAQGRVSYAGGKPFGSKMLYSIKLQNDSAWYNCGERDPNVKSGDNVEFEFNVNPNGKAQVVLPTVRVLAGASQTTVSQSVPSKEFNLRATEKDQYWSNKAIDDKSRDLRIQHQSARNAAIEVVAVLVSKDLLKLPEKNASEAVLGKISDLTERFFKESNAVGPELESDPEFQTSEKVA